MPTAAFVGKPGDAIVSTEMEHHSNLVPWQFLAQQTGATLHYLRLTEDGTLDPVAGPLNESRTSSSSRHHVSNSLGTINDVQALPAGRTRAARCWSSTAPRRRRTGRSTCSELGCDFYAFSGHKMCGPTGVGALWGRARAAGVDAAVPGRRRDDPHGQARAHHVERPALEVRGGHAGIAECIASAPRSTT